MQRGRGSFDQATRRTSSICPPGSNCCSVQFSKSAAAVFVLAGHRAVLRLARRGERLDGLSQQHHPRTIDGALDGACGSELQFLAKSFTPGSHSKFSSCVHNSA